MMEVENNILIPTDFSEQSSIAIGQSYNIARFTKSCLTLLYVLDGSYTEEEAKNKMIILARDIASNAGLEVKTKICKGDVTSEIIKTAKELNAILIFLGTRSYAPLKKFMSYKAFKLVRNPPCPIITIKGKTHRQGCGNIILPLDLTAETKEKVETAIDFAKFFGASISIVSVTDTRDKELFSKLIIFSEQVKNYILKKGVSCTLETLEGNDIARMVVDYANKRNGDLIMIMAKENLNMKELIMGSTAQQIMNLSDIPVFSMLPKNSALL